MDNYIIEVNTDTDRNPNKPHVHGFYARNDSQAKIYLMDYIPDWLSHVIECDGRYVNFTLISLGYDRYTDHTYEDETISEITVRPGRTM